MDERLKCSICGAELTMETTYEFDDQIICEDCFDEHTVICDYCNERIWRENAEGDGDTTVCNYCYDNYYTTCESCGRIICRDYAFYEDNSDYSYCQNCYIEIEERLIKPYDYKPEPIFYGSGDLFYGVELEIDKGGEYNDNAETLLNIANECDYVLYAKHDGSISSGFELVSHPATLDYHMNNFNWSDIFERAIAMNYRSHNTNTCGLHIHVNRSAFGKTYDEQEDIIARIIHFTELHWNELVKFSRRTENNLSRWANRYGISTTAKDTYKKAKDKRCGRYVAVNLENCYTIEFRLFRGTLRYKTFIAALQLVDEICKLSIILNDKGMENMPWSEFVMNISQTDKPELIEYLKSKRLYVNEKVEEKESEEI